MPRYAAIDIGSNSLRMEAAEVTSSEPPQILVSERAVTRLGLSVFRTGRISAEAMDTVCGLLATMAQQYKKLNVVGVRAVATSAVRDASNQKDFLTRASQAIGTGVEIISGQEEARLIHLGVQSRWPHPSQRVLIVDIGGGSAEIILSEKGHVAQAFSKPLGALRLTELFLKADPPREIEIHRLEQYIHERLAAAVTRVGDEKVDRVIATAATASAVVSAVNQIPRAKRDSADRVRASSSQLRKLYEDLCRSSLEQRRKIAGIGPRRAEIIIPGTAVLLSILQSLNLPSLYYCAAGVRDGIIADLHARGAGRELAQLNRDQREIVEAMTTKYGVSLRHARKVARLTNDLFRGLQPLHNLPAQYGRLLEAAAYLHDVGHYVNDTSHHKHSYYLVLNSDMPGFDAKERELVANLCRYHRKAMPTADHANLQPLDAETRRVVTMLSPLLRLADNLDRGHGQRVRSIECTLRNGEVILELQSDKDVGLEAWAAERNGEMFRQVYERPLVITKARA